MLIDDIDFADFTFSNSGWPIAQKKRRITGITGGKNGGKLRLAYGQLPATMTSKIDLQGAQTLFDMGCGPVPYRWRWRTNSRRFMALITVGDAERCRPSCRRAKGRQCPRIQRAWEEDWSDLPRCDIAVLPAPLWWLICARQ